MQTHLSLSEIFIVNKNFDQAPMKTTLDIFENKAFKYD